MWISDCGVPSILKTVPGSRVCGHIVLKCVNISTWRCFPRGASSKRAGRLVHKISGKANKSILTTYIFQPPISSDKNIWSNFQPIYIPYHKLYVRNKPTPFFRRVDFANERMELFPPITSPASIATSSRHQLRWNVKAGFLPSAVKNKDTRR